MPDVNDTIGYVSEINHESSTVILTSTPTMTMPDGFMETNGSQLTTGDQITYRSFADIMNQYIPTQLLQEEITRQSYFHRRFSEGSWHNGGTFNFKDMTYNKKTLRDLYDTKTMRRLNNA